MIIEIIDHPIPTSEYVERVGRPDCGALVTFLGTVRNEHHGRKVLRLDYTAYRPMAEKKMSEIADTLRERYPVQEVAIVHRLGTLEIGEASVLIALALAHRKDGFEALRFAIDTFKEIVPIWKKEYFADGEAVWVEGS